MSRVPPEIDRLMWAVAENPTPNAMDEFGNRYPDFRGELLKRIDMVKGLRTEVKSGAHPRQPIPKFVPQPIHPPTPPRGLYLAFGLGVFAIGFAAATVIDSFHHSKPVMQIPTPVPIDRPLVMPEVIKTNPVPPSVVYRQEPTAPPMPVQPREDDVSLLDKRRSLDVKDTLLIEALSLITAGTKLSLEIGPGFVNQKVTLSFHDMTTKEMLRQMSKDYAFTVSDEGDGHILVLPVSDIDTPETPLTSQRRIGP